MASRKTDTSGDVARGRYELELFLLGGEFYLYEDSRLLAVLNPHNAAAEISYGKLIFSCWGEDWSRSWRVTACETAPQGLKLSCTKQMGRVECAIEVSRQPLSETQWSRQGFAQKLAAMIEESLPSTRVDLRPLSEIFAHMVIHDHRSISAAVAVSAHEPQSYVDRLLGAGLVWIDSLRRKGIDASRLMLFAPRGCATTIATRMTAVETPAATISLFEVDEASRSITPVTAFDQGDLADNLRRSARRAQWHRTCAISAAAAAEIERIRVRAPQVIESRASAGWTLLSIHGLEFARVSNISGRVEFGVGESRKSFKESDRAELSDLVDRLIAQRTAECPDRNAPLFRAQAERWLESILRRDITAIDATLDPQFVYSQVPAYRGEGRSYIDLLATTREGRLVVIELKVAEDEEFPFQGLDYWQRVEWHRLRGDFTRRGYFKGLTIADAPPLLYLVAPLFRFHAATRLIAGSISCRVPVYRIGINEDWRAGVRILLTERLN